MAAKSKRSAVLREVRENPLFSHRVEKSKKGKGSYSRKIKSPQKEGF